MSDATSRRAGLDNVDIDDSDFEPLPENSYGEFGDFQLVGHGE